MPASAGGVEFLAKVDPSELVAWVQAISFEDWPQQRPVDDQLRPAMVSDPEWFGFGAVAAPVVTDLMHFFPGHSVHQRMLSVDMPGHSIEEHTDGQPPNWVTRIHVPLTTNPHACFYSGGLAFNMRVGRAYKVNTRIRHAVDNFGTTPRIHFMFDVRSP